MTADEFDAIVAKVRHDRAYEDVIRREEAALADHDHDPHDLEWNPYV